MIFCSRNSWVWNIKKFQMVKEWPAPLNKVWLCVWVIGPSFYRKTETRFLINCGYFPCRLKLHHEDWCDTLVCSWCACCSEKRFAFWVLHQSIKASQKNIKFQSLFNNPPIHGPFKRQPKTLERSSCVHLRTTQRHTEQASLHTLSLLRTIKSNHWTEEAKVSKENPHSYR